MRPATQVIARCSTYLSRLPFLKNRCSVRVKKADFTERPLLACAVQRRRFPVGESPTRQSLQPEAIGAVMEVTKWLKPSISVSRIGDSANVQAAMRVNAEQAPKRSMCRPTPLPYRGRLKWLDVLSEDYVQLLHRGIGGGMYTRKAYATREAPWRGQR
jgi:hypothetical protein